MEMMFLNGLKEISLGLENGASHSLLSKIKREDRNSISLIKKPLDYIHAKQFYLLIKDRQLLDLVNESNLGSQDLELFLDSDLTLDDKKNLLNNSLFENKLNEFKEILEDEKFSRSYLYNKEIFKIISKSCEFDFSKEENSNVLFVILKYNKSLDYYDKTKFAYYDNIECLRYSSLSNITISSYSKYINSIIKLLDFSYFEFFENLNNLLSEEHSLKNSGEFYSSLINTFVKAKDSEKEEEIKGYIKNIFSNSTKIEWLNYLYGRIDESFDLNELMRLSYQDTFDGISKNPIEILYKNNVLLTKLYDSFSTRRYEHKSLRIRIQLLTKNLKKKAFVKLLTENEDLYRQFNTNSILFNDKFSKIVNLNTLNLQNLEDLDKMENMPSLIDENIPLTFNEFKLLSKSEDLPIKVFYSLMDISIDNRIRLVRELQNISISEIMEFYEEGAIIEGDIIEKVTKILRKNSFKNTIKDLSITISRVVDAELLLLLMEKNKIKPYLKEIKFGSDIVFIIKNYSKINDFSSLLEAKEFLYATDKNYVSMITKLNLNSQFVNSNKRNIIDFCDKGLHKVFNAAMANRHFDSNNRTNLGLLAKAELANKLKDIKFRDEDYFLEIGLEVNQIAKDHWKENISSKDSEFTYSETYDFDRIIRLGEFPVYTCQNWEDGSYSECLLSNFDTNKKMLMATTNDGHNHARSLLRLTKGSDKLIKQTRTSSLRFKDIEESDANNVEIEKNEEHLVLFLEKLYTSLDYNQMLKVKKAFVKLAKRKAADLGAVLVISGDYSDVLDHENPEFEYTEHFLFISYSKNGSQYLDSLSGSAYKDNEGCYKSTRVYMLKDNK